MDAHGLDDVLPGDCRAGTNEGADFLDSEDPGKYSEEELAPTALPAGLRLCHLQGHDPTSRLWDP